MYDIVFSDGAAKYIKENIPIKHRKLMLEKIKLCLGTYLKIKSRRCNKKAIKGTKPVTYRYHVSMTYTLFYVIDDDAERVFVTDVWGINQAHSKYRTA